MSPILNWDEDLYENKEFVSYYSYNPPALNNLKVISDTAQSPGAKYDNKFAGTLTDIGGFSLNYHKHINTGEGGIIITNSKKLAEDKGGWMNLN